MEKLIKIEYPNGIHNIIVTQADITNDGRIVITYYDLTDGMSVSFSELINNNGEYYNNPDCKEWDYYSRRFKPYDTEFSDSVLSSLPRLISIYNNKNTINSDSYIEEIGNKRSKEAAKENHIKAVMYANRGGSLVAYDNYSNLQPVFFKQKEGQTLEVYRRANLNLNDELELCRKIEEELGNRVDVSLIPGERKFKLENGKTYHVSFSSCDDNYFFQEVSASEKLGVDASIPVENSLYPDNLSKALHHELPIEITVNGNDSRYGIQLDFGRKRV